MPTYKYIMNKYKYKYDKYNEFNSEILIIILTMWFKYNVYVITYRPTGILSTLTCSGFFLPCLS